MRKYLKQLLLIMIVPVVAICICLFMYYTVFIRLIDKLLNYVPCTFVSRRQTLLKLLFSKVENLVILQFALVSRLYGGGFNKIFIA